MGTATVETLTRDDANKARETVLADLGMSLEEARLRAAEYLLTPEETAKWRRAEDLTWLLGE